MTEYVSPVANAWMHILHGFTFAQPALELVKSTFNRSIFGHGATRLLIWLGLILWVHLKRSIALWLQCALASNHAPLTAVLTLKYQSWLRIGLSILLLQSLILKVQQSSVWVFLRESTVWLWCKRISEIKFLVGSLFGQHSIQYRFLLTREYS